MKAILLVLGVASAVGQQLQQNQGVASTAVVLASSRRFQARGRHLLQNQFNRDQFSHSKFRDFQQNHRGDTFQQTTFRSNMLMPNNQNRIQNFDNQFQSDGTFLNSGRTFTNQRQEGKGLRFSQNDRSQQNIQNNRFQQKNWNRFNPFQQKSQGNRFRSIAFDQNNRKNSFNQERSSQFQHNFFRQVGDSQNVYEGFAEPLNLPSGASLLMGQIDTSFQCADRPYGYYADQGNDCRVFHVCNPYFFDNGRVETHQYSFMCGEGQIFDQEKLTCVEEYAALSCQESSDFYFKNEKFGRPEEKF